MEKFVFIGIWVHQVQKISRHKFWCMSDDPSVAVNRDTHTWSVGQKGNSLYIFILREMYTFSSNNCSLVSKH